MKRSGLSGPALVVACIALFVALSGGAVAAVVVPMAKRAITAETALNAKKLGGQTPAQIRSSLRGAQGPQGLAGAAGAPGPTGAAGPSGPQGAQGGQGPAGPAGQQGPQGPKGDVGAGLEIVGTVATSADLPASGTTGDAYLVTGDLWVWDGAAWTNAGPGQGTRGRHGPQGPAGAVGPAGPQGMPGTAAVTVHTQAFSFGASGSANDAGEITASCSTGQKAVSGGFTSNGDVFNADTAPTAQDNGWSIYLINAGDSGAAGTVYAICLG